MLRLTVLDDRFYLRAVETGAVVFRIVLYFFKVVLAFVHKHVGRADDAVDHDLGCMETEQEPLFRRTKSELCSA